jgi:hypothetical protein
MGEVDAGSVDATGRAVGAGAAVPAPWLTSASSRVTVGLWPKACFDKPAQ